MLYPGTIFGIAAHVSGETAKAVSTAVLSMPASSFGKWSLVTDFGQVKDLYRTLKRTGRSSADHMLIFGTIR